MQEPATQDRLSPEPDLEIPAATMFEESQTQDETQDRQAPSQTPDIASAAPSQTQDESMDLGDETLVG